MQVRAAVARLSAHANVEPVFFVLIMIGHVLLGDIGEMCVDERFEDGAKYLLPRWFENLKTALSIGCGVVLAPAHVTFWSCRPTTVVAEAKMTSTALRN